MILDHVHIIETEMCYGQEWASNENMPRSGADATSGVGL